MKPYWRIVDEQPGGVPDLCVEGDSVVFRMNVPDEQAWLLIRCAPDGGITAAIADRQAAQRNSLK